MADADVDYWIIPVITNHVMVIRAQVFILSAMDEDLGKKERDSVSSFES